MVIMYCIDVCAPSLSLSLSLSLSASLCCIYSFNLLKRANQITASHVNMVLIEICFCFCDWLRGIRQDDIVTISPGPCD